MNQYQNDGAFSRAVNVAKQNLSAVDASKLEKIAADKRSLQQLTSQLSKRDWENVMRIVNDPEQLRRVLSSPVGQKKLHELLNRIP
jgi:hypothetical protein